MKVTARNRLVSVVNSYLFAGLNEQEMYLALQDAWAEMVAESKKVDEADIVDEEEV